MSWLPFLSVTRAIVALGAKVDAGFAAVNSRLDTLNRSLALSLTALQQQESRIMATVADVQNALDALTAEVTASVARMNENFAALQAAIASGASPDALQKIVDQLQAEAKVLGDARTADTLPPAPTP